MRLFSCSGCCTSCASVLQLPAGGYSFLLLFIEILEAIGEDGTKIALDDNNTGEVSARKATVSAQSNVVSEQVKAAGGYLYWEGEIAMCDLYRDTQLYCIL